MRSYYTKYLHFLVIIVIQTFPPLLPILLNEMGVLLSEMGVLLSEMGVLWNEMGVLLSEMVILFEFVE